MINQSYEGYTNTISNFSFVFLYLLGGGQFCNKLGPVAMSLGLIIDCSFNHLHLTAVIASRLLGTYFCFVLYCLNTIDLKLSQLK